MNESPEAKHGLVALFRLPQLSNLCRINCKELFARRLWLCARVTDRKLAFFIFHIDVCKIIYVGCNTIKD